MNPQPLIDLIKSRLDNIFTAYVQGRDVAPAERFRTEGMMEAICVLKLCSEDEARELLQVCWRKHFEQDLPETPENALRIPVMMKRAPVYPSTK